MDSTTTAVTKTTSDVNRQFIQSIEAPLRSLAKRYPKPAGKVFRYGTVGFRDHSDVLDSVVPRLGILAALRSMATNGVTGVMITASHNPAPDNGLKLIDPNGEMLDISWEKHATYLCNAAEQDVPAAIEAIANDEGISLGSGTGLVFAAMDNRLSSPRFMKLLQEAIEAFGAKCRSFGLLSTPQLHLIIRETNLSPEGASKNIGEDFYFNQLSSAFHKLLALRPPHNTQSYEPSLLVDCANGVGGEKILRLQSLLGDCISINPKNIGDGAVVNYECGADYVNQGRRLPRGFSASDIKGSRLASIDGDADRVVYAYVDESASFHLLDGDKIMALYAGFVIDQLRALAADDVTVGIVQTAYANGAATKYISEQLGLPIVWSPTGVRHLHSRAHHYDIGLYFESNGHGTVLIQDSAVAKLDAALAKNPSEVAVRAHDVLLTMRELINQAVGDALSDLLLVEVVLAHRGWSAADWSKIYTDFPSLLLKVKVADRTIITTTEDETQATGPTGLQAAIDAHVARYRDSRSFVRPSGTEDLVRVYAEARVASDARDLAYDVAGSVFDIAGGVGPRPVKPSDEADVATRKLRDLVVAQGRPLPIGKPLDIAKANEVGVVCVLLAAGQGTRFVAAEPKVTYPFLGKPLARQALDAASSTVVRGKSGLDSVVVVGYAQDLTMETLGKTSFTYVSQPQRLGTGHAVYVALQLLEGYTGDVLVLYADNPGVDAALIQEIVAKHQARKDQYGDSYSGMIVTGLIPDAGSYGRIVRGKNGTVVGIIERKVIDKMAPGEVMLFSDGSAYTKEELRATKEFNSGIVIVRAQDYTDALAGLLPNKTKVNPDQYEYYATDFVSALVSKGKLVDGFVVPSEALWKIEGANTVEELQSLEARVADYRSGTLS